MSRVKIEKQSGAAFKMTAGQVLRVIDPQGCQVSDLFCFAKKPGEEVWTDALSSGRSIDYNETISFTTGHILYSNSGRKMLRILSDTCGSHDFLVTPCSLQMFQMMAQNNKYHPSCLENLVTGLTLFGVNPEQITTTFNIFMNVPVGADGKIRVLKPRSKPEDYIEFVAEIDLIVGLTACSDEGSNGGMCKPIEFEITEA